MDEAKFPLIWKLFKEVNGEAFVRATNAEIVEALGSSIPELQTLSRIIAKRRGIQVVGGG